MASTYEPIATTTLSSTTTYVDFTSFSGYTDLILVVNALQSGTEDIKLRFNSDTGSNYSRTVLYGTGSAAGSLRESNQTNLGFSTYGSPGSTDANRATIILNIFNYANNTTYKTVLSRASRASQGTETEVGLWRSTAAITDIRVSPGFAAVTFSVGSTFTLYGIKAA